MKEPKTTYTLEERRTLAYDPKYNLQFCGSPDISNWSHEDLDLTGVPRESKEKPKKSSKKFLAKTPKSRLSSVNDIK